MRKLLFVAALVLSLSPLRAGEPRVPTIDDLIGLKRPGGVAISPDGTRVAYTVSETNWDENTYETEIFLADSRGGAPVQLTRGKKPVKLPVS